eukprot:gene8422-11390_t
MQSLFPQAAGGRGFGASPPNNTLLSFKAGKCNVSPPTTTGGKFSVTPDLRKGTISITRAEGVVHFKWTNSMNGAVEDDRMVFPGECIFKKVCTGVGRERDRVYMLKFLSGNQTLMFWMQDKSIDKDEDNVKKINELINNPHANSDSTGGNTNAQAGQVVGPDEWMQYLGGSAGQTSGAGSFNNLDLSSILRSVPATNPPANGVGGQQGSTGSGNVLTIEDLQRAMAASRPPNSTPGNTAAPITENAEDQNNSTNSNSDQHDEGGDGEPPMEE